MDIGWSRTHQDTLWRDEGINIVAAIILVLSGKNKLSTRLYLVKKFQFLIVYYFALFWNKFLPTRLPSGRRQPVKKEGQKVLDGFHLDFAVFFFHGLCKQFDQCEDGVDVWGIGIGDTTQFNNGTD